MKGSFQTGRLVPWITLSLVSSCFFLRFPFGWMEWSGAAFSSRRGHGAKWHHLPSPEQLAQPISSAQTEAKPSVSQRLGMVQRQWQLS